MKRNQISLIIIALVFIVPFIIAYYILQSGMDKDLETSNYGKMIMPHINTSVYKFFGQSKVMAEKPDNKVDKAIKLQKIWTILYFNPINDCDKTCKQDIHLLRQIHIALGKDMSRVQRAWLSPPPQYKKPNKNNWANVQQYLTNTYPALIRLRVNGKDRNSFIIALQKHTQGRKIFLVDPLGNVILMWPSHFHGKELLKDLKKLLKFSRIG